MESFNPLFDGAQAESRTRELFQVSGESTASMLVNRRDRQQGRGKESEREEESEGGEEVGG